MAEVEVQIRDIVFKRLGGEIAPDTVNSAAESDSLAVPVDSKSPERSILQNTIYLEVKEIIREEIGNEIRSIIRDSIKTVLR
mmetsp:Transcript_934/g.1489  ORF Transcript_934/g.1489 Transcript_934/m.1489 type:complete len:82 (-) Transcript_934:825-1070(-)